MKVVFQIVSLLLTVVIIGCSQHHPETGPNASKLDVHYGDNSQSDQFQKAEIGSKVQEENDGITYKIDLISAIDFISRKGERVPKSEKVHLKKESVLILEMQVNESVKSALESSKLKMSSDDAVSYLLREIMNDITIHQGKDDFQPYEVMFDGNLTGANKLRVFLFFKGLDITLASYIQYYDRLFGAGLINLKH